MNFTIPTPTEWTLIEVAGVFILFYKIQFSYWLKYFLVRPLVPKITGESIDSPKSRQRWAAISARKVKPLDCYPCLTFWVAVAVAYLSGFELTQAVVHVLTAFFIASLTEKHIEK